jgi:hypothetical protein
MHFELLGEIRNIETIAVGQASGRSRDYASSMVVVVGANEKASPTCAFAMDRSSLRSFIGMMQGMSERRNSRSNDSSRSRVMARGTRKLVICLNNVGYEASLERHKVYVAISDPQAEKLGQLRVIDESGEDYLYDKAAFREVSLPASIRRAVLAAA